MSDLWIDCILDEGNHSTSLQIKLKRKTRRNKLKAEVESLVVILLAVSKSRHLRWSEFLSSRNLRIRIESSKL